MVFVFNGARRQRGAGWWAGGTFAGELGEFTAVGKGKLPPPDSDAWQGRAGARPRPFQRDFLQVRREPQTRLHEIT